MVSPVLLPPAIADAARRILVGDSAVDSVVFDLAVAVDDVADAVRYAAVYRAPAPVSPGDFVVLGAFASDDAANLALRNRRSLRDGLGFVPGPDGSYVVGVVDEAAYLSSVTGDPVDVSPTGMVTFGAPRPAGPAFGAAFPKGDTK